MDPVDPDSDPDPQHCFEASNLMSSVLKSLRLSTPCHLPRQDSTFHRGTEKRRRDGEGSWSNLPVFAGGGFKNVQWSSCGKDDNVVISEVIYSTALPY